ncbi:IS4 family transposase [Deinococcus cellulosilyticus]|uniref:IS4 family transposase n=1 Tax=Deinococcus cellulosilyticus (strain DSM 18568 / NBRC 106333 / KACC 11606 / 5516J-15) TaxID=1223518 RepID=A0A511NC84_DEIC1|nr:IS4 family transposase [Deinococcus cellulosilyticus]GEM50207.1 IS4 family transposase [Deinococcus cellulosilyticus NBRC 106333 = KACC 11606]
MHSTLIRTLREAFPLNQARLYFLAAFLIALIQAETVNLVKVSQRFQSKKNASSESNYKRIRRFISDFTFPHHLYLTFVLQFFKDQPLLLTMDRTNWQFGKNHINFLVIATVRDGIAFPLIWQLLPHAGNSHQTARIELIQQLVEALPVSRIQGLLADREFIGEQWFSELRTLGIKRCIRIRDTDRVGGIPAWMWFKRTEAHVTYSLYRKMTVFGSKMQVVGARTPEGKRILVASDFSARDTLKKYKKRWEIECFFSAVKETGFRFEDTHLTRPERLSTLMTLVGIAFVWAYMVGEWEHQKKPIRVKRHGRKGQSVFRLGLGHLIRVLTQRRFYVPAIKILSCT